MKWSLLCDVCGVPVPPWPRGGALLHLECPGSEARWDSAAGPWGASFPWDAPTVLWRLCSLCALSYVELKRRVIPNMSPLGTRLSLPRASMLPRSNIGLRRLAWLVFIKGELAYTSQ